MAPLRVVRMALLLPLLAAVARAESPGERPAPERPPEVLEGGEIRIEDERLRPVEIFQDSAIESEWVTEEEIREMPALNAAEVVENLAGIRVERRLQGEEAAAWVEGMPPEYTRILVDGRRFSGEIDAVDDLADIPLLNVERIEVLRGGQAIRYGTDVSGAVINVVTKRPPPRGASAAFHGGGGDDGQWLGGGTAAARVGPVGVSVHAEHEQEDGFDPESGTVNVQAGGEDSQTQSTSGHLKLDAPLGDAAAVWADGLYRHEEEDWVPVDGFGSSSRDWDVWRGASGFEWAVGERTNLVGEIGTYQQDTDTQVGRAFQLDESEIYADGFAEHFLETGPLTHVLAIGGDYRTPRLDLDEGPLPPDIDAPELEAQREVEERFHIGSVWLQTETSAFDERVSLVLGARERLHSEFGSELLPQVALLVEPFARFKLRGSWGRSARMPSLRDLYQPPTPQQAGYFLAGDPDLDTEHATSWRAGFEWTPLAWLSVASTAFYNDIDDFIRSQPDGEIVVGEDTVVVEPDPEEIEAITLICEAQALFTPPEQWTSECVSFFENGRMVLPSEQDVLITRPLFRKANLDEVRTWGVESQLRLRVTRHAQLALSYTWLRTSVDDPEIDVDELPNSPEHAVTGRLTLTAPVTATQLTGVARWRDGVIPELSGLGLVTFVDPGQETASSFELDLRVVQPLPVERLELFFDLNNVTDLREIAGLAIRGRHFFLGVRGWFDWEL